MAKFNLLFALLIFAYFDLSSQSQFAPKGAQWWFSFKSSGLIASEGWRHLVYQKDTVVLGKNCKQLALTSYSRYNSTSPYNVFKYNHHVYQSKDSVFVFAGNGWLFRWLTDPLPGRKYVIRQKYNPTSWDFYYNITVDSVKTINVSGVSFKKIWQHGKVIPINGISPGPGGDCPPIYSTIGLETANLDYAQSWGAYDVVGTETICRYRDDNTPTIVFSNPINFCNLITQETTPVEMGNIALKPNPCRDFLYIEGTDFNNTDIQIQIYDFSGRLLKETVTTSAPVIEMDVQDLPMGAYSIYIKGGRSAYRGKFAKI